MHAIKVNEEALVPSPDYTPLERAAIDAFSKLSYASVDFEALLAETGISAEEAGFADKEGLYRHVQELIHEAKRQILATESAPSTSLNTFGYLRWMFQVAVLFELRHPELALIEQRARLDAEQIPPAELEEGEESIGGIETFRDFLTQGILHDDIATWVDTDMAAHLLSTLYYPVSRYLISRMGDKAESLRDGSVSIVYDPFTQDLFENLMDLIEAGMGRDPMIRKTIFCK